MNYSAKYTTNLRLNYWWNSVWLSPGGSSGTCLVDYDSSIEKKLLYNRKYCSRESPRECSIVTITSQLPTVKWWADHLVLFLPALPVRHWRANTWGRACTRCFILQARESKWKSLAMIDRTGLPYSSWKFLIFYYKIQHVLRPHCRTSVHTMHEQ